MAVSAAGTGASLRPSPLRAARAAVRALQLCRQAAGAWFTISAGLQLVTGAALAVQIFAARRLLAELLGVHGSLANRQVATSVSLLVIALAVVASATAVRAAVQPVVGERIGRHAIDRVLAVAVRADLVEYEQPALHNEIQYALVHAALRPGQLASVVLGMVGASAGIVGAGVSLLTISPLLVLIVVVGALPAYLSSRRTAALVHAFTKQQTESDRRRTYFQALMVSRDAAKEIRGYQLEDSLLGTWRDLSEQRLATLEGITRRRVRVALVTSIAGALVTGAAVVVLLVLVDHHRVSLAAAGASAFALLLLASQLQAMAVSASAFVDSLRFVDDFFSFVETPRTRLFAGADPPGALSVVAARDVSYRYPSGGTAIERIDVEIRAGEVVAFVGQNGSGKTTLANLLGGLLTATTGAVTWNGRSYTDLDIDAVRAAVTPVFQHPAHLQVSVDEYLATGRANAAPDGDRASAALRELDLEDVVDALPHAGQTVLGPEFFGGCDLSGGEWQRLALARALYRGGELVILDEPASALDSLAEAALFGNARLLFPNRAVVLISHRFGSVRAADRIYVMNGGRVVEVGDHDALVAADGLYAQMFAAQQESLLGSH